MTDLLPELIYEYKSALESYLLEANEADLKKAYEIGRKVITEKLSVMDLAQAHHDAIIAILQKDTSTDETVHTIKGACDLFMESLSLFDIIHRGFREANIELQLKNKVLNEKINELATLNKELESFSYSVSHDLKAPLRSIDGFSHVLLEDYLDKLDDEGKDYLNRVSAASQKMSHLIDAMLILSRLTRGEINRVDVDLTDVVKSTASSLQESQPDRKVEFVIAENVTANGDAAMVNAVIENLLGNAWKFTGKHPTARIEFGVTEKDGKTVYFVKDDGAGFDPKYSDKLFVPFQRLHTESEFPGIGIGLATVQRIIHRHRGHIWAEGEIEKGATAYFTLE